MKLPYPKELKEHLEQLQNTIQIHNVDNIYSQYYEMSSSFSIQIATNHPEELESSYRLVTLAPGVQTNTVLSRKLIETVSLPSSSHQINCTRIMYVLEGNIYLRIEGKRILYTPGSCYLIDRNIRHMEEFNTDYQVIFLNLSDSFVRHLYDLRSSFLFAEELSYSSLLLEYLYREISASDGVLKSYLDFYPVLYEDRQRKKMHDIFEQMIWILLSPDFGATCQLQALFCRLITVLSSRKYYHVTSVRPTSGLDSIIFNRINQLLENSNGRISRKELCELLNYSGSYLNRIVKKSTGMSLFDYSMTFCLTTACYLLLNTEESIASIMDTLHFTNQTHFYHLFREKYGMSPNEYRKKMKKNSTAAS